MCLLIYGMIKMVPFTNLSRYESAQRFLLLMMLLSFAVIVYCLSVLLKQFGDPSLVSKPHFIALLVAISVFALSLITLCIVSCCSNSYIRQEQAKQNNNGTSHYSYEFKLSTVALMVCASISLVSSSVFFGSIVRNAEEFNILSAVSDFTNPLCTGLYASLAVLLVSVVALAIKNVISPETSNSYIFICDQPIPEKTLDKICQKVITHPNLVCFVSSEQLCNGIN
ncbi:Hypothetical protein ERGA_CDS_08500 [Ehrlichia ruminantium str. Gardel]|nr:Hypothetical protein ERGA_CDS_08500 [Ehrlichia ruminantium str. Gardel]